MTIDMSQFYQVFFEESSELLEEMERLLLELDVAEPGKDALNAIFRTAHSIKGGSATFGFNEITETTHILESLLDKLRNDELRLRIDMVDVFLKAVDVIKMQLAGRQFASEVDTQAVAEFASPNEPATGASGRPAPSGGGEGQKGCEGGGGQSCPNPVRTLRNERRRRPAGKPTPLPRPSGTAGWLLHRGATPAARSRHRGSGGGGANRRRGDLHQAPPRQRPRRQ